MGRLRTAMRAYAIEHAAPADVLRHLVDYHALTRPDVFATVVYAALDRDQRRLRIASLGHPMPLVIRGGLLVPLPAQIEPPLGAEAERSFREVAVPVHDGDVLVFVTDGVFERADTPWDESMAHLARHAARGGSLPIERLADQLIAAINDDASARDDRALVVVRVPVGTSPGTEADDGASAARGGTAPPKTAAAPLLQSDG
jgi:serine phosphatase RsbU (regulator of sigma subunit)